MSTLKKNNKLWLVLMMIVGITIAFFIFNGDHLLNRPSVESFNDVNKEESNIITSNAIIGKDSIPAYVRGTYNYIKQHSDAPPGYYGGKLFQNREKRLPIKQKNGLIINYREWDVHPRRDGIDRGAERIVTGSDGTGWYTQDHYNTFILIE